MLEHTATDPQSVGERGARERRRQRAKKQDALALLGLILALNIFLLFGGLWVLSA